MPYIIVFLLPGLKCVQYLFWVYSLATRVSDIFETTNILIKMLHAVRLHTHGCLFLFRNETFVLLEKCSITRDGKSTSSAWLLKLWPTWEVSSITLVFQRDWNSSSARLPYLYISPFILIFQLPSPSGYQLKIERAQQKYSKGILCV